MFVECSERERERKRVISNTLLIYYLYIYLSLVCVREIESNEEPLDSTVAEVQNYRTFRPSRDRF